MKFKSDQEVKEYIESDKWFLARYRGRFTLYIAREKEPKLKIIKSLKTELQKEKESTFADVPREILLEGVKNELSKIKKKSVEAFRNQPGYSDRKERFDNLKKEIGRLF
jgi:hypothetical protein